MMKVTSVRIKRGKSITDSRLLGTASIQLDDCLIIHGIRLLQLKDKRVISFPNKKIKKVDVNSNEERYEYTDMVHPSNSEFRKYLEDEIFKYYDMGGITNNE